MYSNIRIFIDVQRCEDLVTACSLRSDFAEAHVLVLPGPVTFVAD